MALRPWWVGPPPAGGFHDTCPFHTEDEAIALNSDTEYGLTAAIMTADEPHALRMAGRLETGMVHVNCRNINDEPHVPFGGVKASGVGRYGGRWSLVAFTELRWITLDRAAVISGRTSDRGNREDWTWVSSAGSSCCSSSSLRSSCLRHGSIAARQTRSARELAIREAEIAQLRALDIAEQERGILTFAKSEEDRRGKGRSDDRAHRRHQGRGRAADPLPDGRGRAAQADCPARRRAGCRSERDQGTHRRRKRRGGVQLVKPAEKIRGINIHHIGGLARSGETGASSAVGQTIESILDMAVALPTMERMGGSIGGDLDGLLGEKEKK